jgi:ProP effector
MSSKNKGAFDPATVHATLELLAEHYPRCFVLHQIKRGPLKIGIRDDLLQAFAGAISASELSAALRIYTSNRVYRERLIAGAPRFDLNGEVAGYVTPEEAAQVPPPKRREAKDAPRKPSNSPATSVKAVPLRLSLSGLREAAKLRRESPLSGRPATKAAS